MIAEIKKHTFLVHHSDYTELLDTLREAGVVHIIQKRKLDETSSIGNDIKLLKRYKKAIQQLSHRIPEIIPSDIPEDPEKILADFESSMKEIEETKQKIELLRPEASRIKPWGNFDVNAFNKLKDSGWSLSLFICPQKRFKDNWTESFALEIIGRDKGKIYFAIIHKDNEFPDIDADQEKIPERPAESVFEEISVYEEKNKKVESGIQLSAPVWLSSLKRGYDSTISKIEYSEAAEQADKYAENNLYILEGWVPVSEENKIKEILDKSDCYSFISEPDINEKIPVILVNNKFAKLFEPISKMFALPDYRELDLTPFFAPFFMLFFGFCLGDAGYGLLFILTGFFVKRRIKPEFKPIVTLAQYLGIATILFGLVSGTFFGMNLIDTGYTITEQSLLHMKEGGVSDKVISLLDQIKGETFLTRKSFTGEVVSVIGEDEFAGNRNIILKNAESNYSILNSFRHLMLDSISMFYLAIIIGGMQIIFGMILRIFNISKRKGFKYSLSTIGWVILALTIIVFKGGSELNLIDESQMKPVFTGLLIFSGVLIFLFNNPGLNIFLRIGSGVWDTYSILTGVFGDLLSYIRLFALGISSAILGFVFNDISQQMLSVPYVGWLFFLLILLIGHSMNIAMATLGSFVHPMRLTFVEFYKNAGFIGGGIQYKPFKIKE
ncbi:MAG TPA: V-type ATPase 116kDa subunit family protein [Bacteroidales bacterium]|nr:V-type ATPase 116kDa subunit family protein [Bacteroidales bacterium]